MEPNEVILLWAVASALYGGIVTTYVYRRRDRSGRSGFYAGAVLGALGSVLVLLLVIALTPPEESPDVSYVVIEDPESQAVQVMRQLNEDAGPPSSLLILGGLVGGLLFLVPLWWLVPRHGKQCTYCYATVSVHAIVCSHCGNKFPGAPPPWREDQPLLDVRDLRIEYASRDGRVVAVDGVNLDIRKGELMALVGESGCGKSTLAYGLIRHVTFPGQVTGGRILFQGHDVLELTDEQLRQFRWKNVAVVFQAAQNAMNPVMRVADQFIDTVQAHEPQDREQIVRKAAELLRLVRLNPNQVLRAYPFELSGGMRQRVILALSLLLDPELLILDEPTTALDVVTQVHILDILKEVRDKLGLTMLMSTHDMSIVARVADRVAVMYAGKIVEVASIRDIFYQPFHPYSAGLTQAAPSLVGELGSKRPIPGNPPDFMNMPSGCRFHPRCSFAIERCKDRPPETEFTGDGRVVACHRWREIAEELQR
jgi:peptide/nickel transport system ATP-binding protein